MRLLGEVIPSPFLTFSSLYHLIKNILAIQA
jgi:hypothetical protein